MEHDIHAGYRERSVHQRTLQAVPRQGRIRPMGPPQRDATLGAEGVFHLDVSAEHHLRLVRPLLAGDRRRDEAAGEVAADGATGRVLGGQIVVFRLPRVLESAGASPDPSVQAVGCGVLERWVLAGCNCHTQRPELRLHVGYFRRQRAGLGRDLHKAGCVCGCLLVKGSLGCAGPQPCLRTGPLLVSAEVPDIS